MINKTVKNTDSSAPRALRALLAAAAFGLAALPVSAATWTGAAGDGNWATAGNWATPAAVPGTVAGTYDEAIFSSILVSNVLNVNIASAVSLNNLSAALYNSASQPSNLNLSGTGSLVFGGSNARIFSDQGFALNVNVPVSLQSDLTLTAQGNSIVINGALTANNNAITVATAPGKLVRIATGATGLGGLTKTGDGSLELASANTFAAGAFANISSGKLVIGNNDALGAAHVVFGDSLAPDALVTLDTAGGVRTLSNAFDWNNRYLSVTGTGSSLTLAPSASNNITINDSRTLDIGQGASLTFGANVSFSGSGTLTKAGVGALTLRGLNSTIANFAATNGSVFAGDALTAGHFTLGSADAGHNPFGTGAISVTGDGTRLVVDPGSDAEGFVNYAGNITLGGGSMFEQLAGRANIAAGGVLDGGSAGTNANAFIFRVSELNIAAGAALLRAPEIQLYGDAVITGSFTGAASRFLLSGAVTLAPGASIEASLFEIGERSKLTLVEPNSVRAGGLRLGNAGELVTNDTNQTLGGLSWTNSAAFADSSRLTFREDTTVANTLLFGTGSTGGTGMLLVTGWTPGYNHLQFGQDVTAAAWAQNIKFQGYNWTVAKHIFETTPGSGIFEVEPGLVGSGNTYIWNSLADYGGTALKSTNNLWKDGGNWDRNRSPDGAGVEARFTTLDTAFSGKTIDFSKRIGTDLAYKDITLGKLTMSAVLAANTFIGGSSALYFDNAGSQAEINTVMANGNQFNINSAIKLSDKGLKYTNTGAGLGSFNFSGTISGTGNMDFYATSNTTSVVGLSGNNTGYSGTTTIYSGLVYGNSANNFGTGPIVMQGGYIGSGTQTYTNQFIINNDFGIKTGGITFASATPATPSATDVVQITGNKTISFPAGVASLGLIFDKGRDLQGTGTLTVNTGQDQYGSSVASLAGNSNFSGGLVLTGRGRYGVGTGAVETSTNVTLGKLVAGENYAGIGDITFSNTANYGIYGTAALSFAMGGAANYLDFQNNVKITNAGNQSYVPTIAMEGTFETVKFSSVTFAGNLAIQSTSKRTFLIGDVTITPGSKIDFYAFTNRNAGLAFTAGDVWIKSIDATRRDFGNLNSFTTGIYGTPSTYYTAYIDSSIKTLSSDAFIIGNGRLKLMADNQIGGIAALTMQTNSVLDTAGYSNTFGTLTMQAPAAFALGTGGQLTLAGVSSAATAGWALIAGTTTPVPLNITGDTGIWNTMASVGNGLASEHVWLTSTNNFTADRLGAVSFTGMTRGADIRTVTAGSLWELVTAGQAAFEWIGTGTTWTTGSNWFGGTAPGAADQSHIAIFRNQDAGLTGKTITVAGKQELWQLNFESTAGQSYSLSGGTLAFVAKGSERAGINMIAPSVPNIKSGILLDGLGLLVNNQSSGGAISLTGVISETAAAAAAGGASLTLQAASTSGQYYLSANNTFSGGVEFKGGYLSFYTGTASAPSTNTVLGTGTFSIIPAAGEVAQLGGHNVILKNDVYIDTHETGQFRLVSSLTFNGDSAASPSHINLAGGTHKIWTSNETTTLTFGSNAIIQDAVTGSPSALYWANGINTNVTLLGQNTFSGGFNFARGNVGGKLILGVSSIWKDDNNHSLGLKSGPLGTGALKITGVDSFATTTLHVTAGHVTIGNDVVIAPETTVGGWFAWGFSGNSSSSLTFDSVNPISYRLKQTEIVNDTLNVIFKSQLDLPILGIGSMGNYLVRFYNSKNSFDSVDIGSKSRTAKVSIAGDNVLGGASVNVVVNNGVSYSTIEAYGNGSGDHTLTNNTFYIGDAAGTFTNGLRFTALKETGDTIGGAALPTYNKLRIAGSGTTFLNNKSRNFILETGTVAGGYSTVAVSYAATHDITNGGLRVTSNINNNAASLLLAGTRSTLELLGTKTFKGWLTAGYSADTTQYGLVIDDYAVVTTTLTGGRDAVIGGAADAAHDTPFGQGHILLNNGDLIINAGAGSDVNLELDSMELVQGNFTIQGGGNLILGHKHTGEYFAQNITGRMGGSGAALLQATNGSTIVIDSGTDGGGNLNKLNLRVAIAGAVEVKSGLWEMSGANILGGVTSLTLTGGVLNLNHRSQALAPTGILSLAGSAAGVLDFDYNGGSGNTTGTIFTVGTLTDGRLTIKSWNGNTAGGGRDRIIVLNSDGLLAANTIFKDIGFDGYSMRSKLVLSGGLLELVPAGKLYLWTGSDSSDDLDWTKGDNWDLHTVPNAVGAEIAFGDYSQTLNAHLPASGQTVSGVYFTGDQSRTFVIDGANASTALMLTGEGTDSAVIQLRDNAGARIDSRIALGSNLTVDAATGTTVEISGLIYEGFNSNSVTKEGAGTLVLSSSENAFTGGFQLNEGLVRVSADEVLSGSSITSAPLGRGLLTLRGGTLESVGSDRTFSNVVLLDGGVTVGGTTTVTLDNKSGLSQVLSDSVLNVPADAGLIIGASNAFSGSGKITKDGAGTLTVNSTNTFTGGFDFNAGTVLANTNKALGDGTATFTGDATLALGTNGFAVTNAFSVDTGVTGTIDTGANTGTFSGNITGGGSLEKIGTGTLDITGALGANTTVTGGEVHIGTGGTAGTFSSAITVAAGKKLVLDRSDNASMAGSVDGSGDLWKKSAGAITLSGINGGTGTGLNTYIEEGVLKIAGTLNSNIAQIGVTAGKNTGALEIATGGTWTAAQELQIGVADKGAFVVSGGTATTLSGVSIGKTASGTNSSATISGGTWNNTGALKVGDAATGTLNATGGTLTSTSLTVGNGTNAGTLTVSGTGLVKNTDTAGTGIGAVGIIKLDTTGTLETTKLVQTAAGAKVVFDGGRLRAGADSTDFISGFAATNVTLGANGGIIDTNGHDVTIATVISGASGVSNASGDLVKESDGTLTLTVANNYANGTTVKAGTLVIRDAGKVGTGTVQIDAPAAFRYDAMTGGGAGTTNTLMNALSGSGLFIVNNATVDTARKFQLGNDADIAQQQGAAFTGTVQMRASNYTIDDIETAFLNASGTGATLETRAGSKGVISASTTPWEIKNTLTLAGGNLAWNFDLNNKAEGTLDVGTLVIKGDDAGAGTEKTTLTVRIADTVSASKTAGDVSGASLFHQDFNDPPIQLLTAGTVTGSASDTNLKLYQYWTTESGTTYHADTLLSDLTSVNTIINQTENVADGTYGWAMQVVDSGTDKGFNVGYALTKLAIYGGQTLTLAQTGETGESNEFGVQIVDRDATAGNLVIAPLAANTVTMRSGTGALANAYTGTTAVSQGKVILGTDGVTGTAAKHTSALNIAALATVALADATTNYAGTLNITSGGKLDFGTGTTGGTLTLDAATAGLVAGDGAILGKGTLNVNAGTLTISGANTAANVSTNIAAPAKVVLNKTNGLGTTAPIAITGTLDLAGTGVGNLANALSGTGKVSLTGNSDVTLTAVANTLTNAAVFDIASNAKLTATTVAQLGAAKIDDKGTFTLNLASGTETLTNTFDGAGTFIKLGAGEIAINTANPRTGTTTITAGRITLGNLAGLGNGAIANNATLNLNAAGTLTNDISGTGTNIVAAGKTIALTGNNATFTGTWDVDGTANFTAQSQLGTVGANGAKMDISGTANISPGNVNFVFDQKLTGAGLLKITQNGTSNTFNFGTAVGAAFTGKVELANNAFTLNAANAAPLAGATLQLDTGNFTTVATGQQNVGNLTLAGATMQFDLTDAGTAGNAKGWVKTGTLDLGTAETVNVVRVDPTLLSGGTAGGLSLLQQDDGSVIKLIESTNTPVVQNVQLADLDGNAIAAAAAQNILQNSVIVAKGIYGFGVDYTNGIGLSYALQELQLITTGTGATKLSDPQNPPLKGDEFHARITGAGDIIIDAGATGTITLNQHSSNAADANTYTGKTTLEQGTFVLGHNNVLGTAASHTSSLNITAGTVKLNDTAQVVGALNITSGGKLNFGTTGALTLDGTVENAGTVNGDGALLGNGTLTVTGGTLTVKGANTALLATTIIGTGGTVVAEKINSLGTGGVSADGLLQLKGTTGNFANNLSSTGTTGTVRLTNAAVVTLAGDNSAFGGTYDIDSVIAGANQLTITTEKNFGGAKEVKIGTGKEFVANVGSTDGFTLTKSAALGQISGDGTFRKIGTGTVTLAAANSGFTGTTTIAGGNLKITAAGALGTSVASTTIDGKLDIALAAAGTVGNTITNKGEVNILAGSAAATLSVAIANSGTVNVNGDGNTLSVALDGTAGGIVNIAGDTNTLGTIAAKTLNVLAGAEGNTFTGAITNVEAVTVAGTDTAFTGTLTGIGSGATGTAINVTGTGTTFTGDVSAFRILTISGDDTTLNKLANGAAVSVTAGTTYLNGAANSAFAGTWNIGANGTVEIAAGTTGSASHLGTNTVTVDGALNVAQTTANDYAFSNKLAGTGVVTATLGAADKKFSFANTAAGGSFTGKLALDKGTYAFSTEDKTGVGVLKDGTLQLGANGSATLDQNYTIGNLAMAGGTLNVNLTNNKSDGILTVKNLTSTGGTIAVNLTQTAFNIDPVSPGTNDPKLFDEDTGQLLTAIVRATVSADGTGLVWSPDIGSTSAQVFDLKQSGEITGKLHYDYKGEILNDATNKGIFLTYGLTEIESLKTAAGEAVVLTNAGNTDNTLSAKLTGGNFVFTGSGASGARIGGTTGSNYTGTTEINGKVTLIATNSMGLTKSLTLNATADVAVTADQIVGGLTGIAGSKLALDGHTLTVNTQSSGTGNATLADTAINLGAAGKLDIAGNATISGTTTNNVITGTGASALAVGGTLTTTDGTITLAAGSVSAKVIDAARTAITAASLTATDSLVSKNNTVVVSGEISATDATLTTANVSANEVVLTGNAIVQTASTVTLTGAAAKLNVAGTTGITGGSTANLAGGTATLTGALTLGTNASDTSKLNLGTTGGTLNINGGGTSNGTGALVGSTTGTINVNGSGKTFVVHGANAALHAKANIAAGAKAQLDNVAGLGDGIVNTSTTGTLELNGTGATLGNLVNKLEGAGDVVVTNSSNIALTGNNADFLGEYDILAGANKLTVTKSSEFGGAQQVNIGTGATFVANVATADSFTLTKSNGTGALAGTGAFIKQGDGIVTLAGANADFSGATTVENGTLTLTNLNALGDNHAADGAITLGAGANNGILKVDTTSGNAGKFAKAINFANAGSVANITANAANLAFGSALTGTGEVKIDATGVTLENNTNTAFAGKWTVSNGASATIAVGASVASSTAHLGNTATVTLAGTGTLNVEPAAAAYAFNNKLSGTGVLDVTMTNNTDAFSFGANAKGGNYAGIVRLENGTFALTGDNTATLTKATLNLGAGNVTTVGTAGDTATQKIGSLVIDGATLKFNASLPGDTAAHGIIELDATGTLAITANSGNVVISNFNTGGSGYTGTPLIEQDHNGGTQLVKSTYAAVGVANMKLYNGSVSPANEITANTTADIKNAANETVAAGYYGFGLSNTDGSGNNGIFVSHKLSHVEILAGKQLLLEDTASDGDFDATIGGTGKLAISASNSVTLTRDNLNDHAKGTAFTGETLVTAGKLIAGADNALGQTSLLTLETATQFNLHGFEQTLGAFDGANNTLLDLGTGGDLTIENGGVSKGSLQGSGSLNLAGGTLEVYNANANLSAATTIADGATVQLHSAGGLGTGSINTSTTGTLDLNGVGTGMFVNDIAGTGTVALTKNGATISTVTLGSADNSGFAGTWDIRANNKLTATADGQLGSVDAIAKIAGTLELATADNWTLANEITDGAVSGTLVKSGSGEITIARANTGFTGETIINDGALKLTNVAGIGGGRVTTNANAPELGTFEIAFSGADNANREIFENNIVNAGEVLVSGSNINITGEVSNNGHMLVSGDNVALSCVITSAAGEVEITGANVEISGCNDLLDTNHCFYINGGRALATDATNLGNASVCIGNSSMHPAPFALFAVSGNDSSLSINHAGDYTFVNVLNGDGELFVDLSDATSANTFAFANTVGSAFTGRVVLNNAAFALGGDNTVALTNATLVMNAGNTTTVVAGDQSIGNLAFNGGTAIFDTTVPADVRAAGIAVVNDLDLSVGKVVVTIPDTNNTPNPAVAQLPLMLQDDGGNTLLVRANGTVSGSAGSLTLYNGDTKIGATETGVSVYQNGVEVAKGDYGYTLTENGNDGGKGLYVGYGLQRIVINDGKKLVLDDEGHTEPGATKFGVEISGTGELEIHGSTPATVIEIGNINSDYTGKTTLSQGEAKLISDNALGKTEELQIFSGTKLDLGGKTQEIGIFTGDAGSLLDLNGGNLVINKDGSVSEGSLQGDGKLTLNGDLELKGNSQNLTGEIYIGADKTLTVFAPANLGDAKITGGFCGNLNLNYTDTSADWNFGNEIGEGVHLSKNDAGTVSLKNNYTITCGVDINAGTLIAGGSLTVPTTKSDGSASGKTITVGPQGTLGGGLNGDIAANIINAGTIALGNALNHPDFAGKSVAATTIRGDVANSGKIYIGNTSGALVGNTLSITGGYAGTGQIFMNVDFTTGKADLLKIGTTTAGATHTLTLTAVDGVVKTGSAIKLVETGDGLATFIAGEILIPGTDQKYSLVRGNADGYNIGGSANDWYLAMLSGSTPVPPRSSILGIATSMTPNWFLELDSLIKRMGELRISGPSSRYTDKNGDTDYHSSAIGGGEIGWEGWARGYGWQNNVDSRVGGVAYKEYVYGGDVGLDKQWMLDDGALYTGAFIGGQHSKKTFTDNAGKGDIDAYNAGLYATYIGYTGWYFDLVAKGTMYDSEYDAYTDAGKTSADYTTWVAGISLETGKRFTSQNGWFAEPSVQLAYAHYFNETYDATGSDAARVQMQDADSFQVRAGVMAGKRFVSEVGTFQPYIKAYAAQIWTSGNHVRIADERGQTDWDGIRVELGAGINYEIPNSGQLYLDYEYIKGQGYEIPWKVNAGYRIQW